MTSSVRQSRATPLLVWLAALLALLVTAPRLASAADYDRDVDVSTFYDELEDDGDWIEHPRHGYVWTPSVDDDWRPYTRGRWENTEEHGWYWESEEPFGWAVYHYGRWGYDDDIGWYWVPGRKWGPAWVDWRHSEEEIGWRPLAPDEDWEPSGSLRIRAAYYDEPTYAPRWIFVSPRYFVEPSIHLHLFPRTQSVVFLGRTRRVTTYRVVNQRIFNTGLTISFVQRYAPRPIVARRITVTETRFVRPGASTTVINVYRPKALRTTTTTTVRLAKPRTVVNRTVVVQKKQVIRTQPAAAGINARRQDRLEEIRDNRQDRLKELRDNRQDRLEDRRDNRQDRLEELRDKRQDRIEDIKERRQDNLRQQQQQRAARQDRLEEIKEKRQQNLQERQLKKAGPGPGGPGPGQQAATGPNGPNANRKAGPGPNGPNPNRQAGARQGGPGGPGGPGPGGQGGPKKKQQDENPNKKKNQQNQN